MLKFWDFGPNFCMWPINIQTNKCYIATWGQRWLLPWYRKITRFQYAVRGRVNKINICMIFFHLQILWYRDPLWFYFVYLFQRIYWYCKTKNFSILSLKQFPAIEGQGLIETWYNISAKLINTTLWFCLLNLKESSSDFVDEKE